MRPEVLTWSAVCTWCSKQPEGYTSAQLALHFYKRMTPESKSTKRSHFREEFMCGLVRDADVISLDFIRDRSWTSACTDYPNMITPLSIHT